MLNLFKFKLIVFKILTKDLCFADYPVRYTVLELVPGIFKIQRVWIGLYDQPSNKVATEHILAWCKEKLVPDGARDILVSFVFQCGIATDIKSSLIIFQLKFSYYCLNKHQVFLFS